MELKQFKQLINQQGEPELGHFQRPFGLFNHQDYLYKTPMGRETSRLRRYFKPNHFQFMGLLSPELIVGVAIVDLKYASNAFVYYFMPETNTFREFSYIQPFARRTAFSPHPDQHQCHFQKGKVYFKIDLPEQAQGRVRHAIVHIPKMLELEFTLTEPTNGTPLAMCSPAGANGWVYTQKFAGLQVEGQLQLPGKVAISLSNPSLSGLYDWSCGYMRRETAWRWACCSLVHDAQFAGFNFAVGVNESGTTENCCWQNNQFSVLPPINIRPTAHPDQWTVQSQDGSVDLQFCAKGLRAEKINLLLLASNFKQFFGQFTGRIQHQHGCLMLNGEYGFLESHYAKW